MKNLPTFEQFINEEKVDIEKLAQIVYDADKDKSKGWNSIAIKPSINGKEITIAVHPGDSKVKKYLNGLLNDSGAKTKFVDVERHRDLHYYSWIVESFDLINEYGPRKTGHEFTDDMNNTLELWFVQKPKQFEVAWHNFLVRWNLDQKIKKMPKSEEDFERIEKELGVLNKVNPRIFANFINSL